MIVDRRRLLAGATALGGLSLAPGVALAATPWREAMREKLLAYMAQHRADWGLPGLTLTAVDRAGRVMTLASGLADVDRKVPVRSDQLFQIGSITKMMTALAIWSLVDDGKLTTSARVADLLPGFAIKDGEAVTLQHLLDHTSGLPGGPPLFSLDGLWSGFTPGTRWTYSNAGYDIAGLIAARAGGMPFPDLVEARVLRPLGMKASAGGLRARDRLRYAQGYQPTFLDRVSPRPAPLSTAPWVDSGAGCIAATTDDMTLFLKFLLGLAAGRGGPVFSDRTARRFLANPADGWGPGSKYGNGVARVSINKRRYLHHTGGMVSFSSALHVDPEAGVAAFASSNVSYLLGYRPRDVTVFACELLRARGAELPAPPSTRAVVANPSAYAGVYTAQSGARFEIVAANDSLRLRNGGRETELQPAGALFATEDPDFPLGLLIELKDDKALRAWAKDVEFRRDAATPWRSPPAAELRRLAGRYDNDDPWQGSVWIVARDGRLWLNNTEPLTELGHGVFRAGEDEWSPERVRFDGFIDGRPERVIVSGSAFQRRFG